MQNEKDIAPAFYFYNVIFSGVVGLVRSILLPLLATKIQKPTCLFKLPQEPTHVFPWLLWCRKCRMLG